MIFNSFSFLLFFSAFFVLYWWLSKRFGVSMRNGFILLASYFFYGSWDWRFLGLIVFSSTVDYIIGLLLEKENRIKNRKVLLGISIFFNLGLLAFFKYFDFFIDSLSQLFDTLNLPFHAPTLAIVLPVGISFYTFQTMSYTIDIYRKEIKATRNVLAFFSFVAFFPQLVAGPIERASRLLPQFFENQKFDYSRSIQGLRLFLWGLFKKVVIADSFGTIANILFENHVEGNGLAVILGTFCFGIQIYGDFSGYSDMAIGISRMLGFDLMTNFRTPYFSKSFSEFWQRWHISLSTWFGDYLYIPLGGNKNRLYRNIMITFLLSGLWHGANFTFIIWGFLHGLALVLERHFKLTNFKHLYSVFVIVLVFLFWLPFRSESVSQMLASTYQLTQVFNYSTSFVADILFEFEITKLVSLITIFIGFAMIELRLKKSDFNDWIQKKSKSAQLELYYALALLILFFIQLGAKPNFIYFQF